MVLVAGLLTWDHLIGNENGAGDAFPVDPGTFGVALAVALALAVLTFGVVVPRALQDGARVTTYAVVLAGLAVVTAPFATWFGIPQVLAGGSIVLGRASRAAGHHGAGTAAVVLSLIVLGFGVVATAFPPTEPQGGSGGWSRRPAPEEPVSARVQTALAMSTTSGGRLEPTVPRMLPPRGRQYPSRSATAIARLASSM